MTLLTKLPPLPNHPWRLAPIWDEDEVKVIQDYGQHCKENIIELVKAVHKAKGRYHSQIAMCNLYDACDLPNQRPVK